MAFLFFNFRGIELNPALANIGELKNVIFHSVLRERGFADVVNTQTEVAGTRDGVRVSVLHLSTGGRGFWRVCMAAGDTEGTTSSTLNEVVGEIERLVFL